MTEGFKLPCGFPIAVPMSLQITGTVAGILTHLPFRSMNHPLLVSVALALLDSLFTSIPRRFLKTGSEDTYHVLSLKRPHHFPLYIYIEDDVVKVHHRHNLKI